MFLHVQLYKSKIIIKIIVNIGKHTAYFHLNAIKLQTA